jgi:hypothetical protein
VKTVYYHAVSNGYDKPQKPRSICQHSCYTVIAGACSKEHGAMWNRYFKIIGTPQMAPYSVYMDANIGLEFDTCTTNEWVDEVLKDADLAICRHAARKCAYVEVEACVGRNKINAKQAAAAHEHLSACALPKNFGLWECGIILRRAGVQWVTELMTTWWAHIKATGIVRDQLWLPVAVHMMKNRIPAGRFVTLDMNVRDNKLFTFKKHA